MEDRVMTIKEAIYCMRAHLNGSSDYVVCRGCPYYDRMGDNLEKCKSNVAHEMAAAALELLLEDK